LNVAGNISAFYFPSPLTDRNSRALKKARRNDTVAVLLEFDRPKEHSGEHHSFPFHLFCRECENAFFSRPYKEMHVIDYSGGIDVSATTVNGKP
jgi:hypothetical protein